MANFIKRDFFAAALATLLFACGSPQTAAPAPTDQDDKPSPPVVDVFPSGDDAPTPRSDEPPATPGFLRSQLFYAGGGYSPAVSWGLFDGRVRPALSDCYAEQLGRDPRAGGLLTLEVRGTQTGAIHEAIIKGVGDSTMHACIKRTLVALHHPRPDSGGSPMARWQVMLYPTAAEAPALPSRKRGEKIVRALDGGCVGVTKFPCPRRKSCRAAEKRLVACP